MKSVNELIKSNSIDNKYDLLGTGPNLFRGPRVREALKYLVDHLVYQNPMLRVILVGSR